MLLRTLTFLLLATAAGADHHVALVIAGKPAVAGELAALGYRCQTSENLSEKELSRLVESWASRTPTNSTALVHFTGKTTTDNGALHLVTANDRKVAVERLVGYLADRGGSRYGRLVIDSPSTFDPPAALPGRVTVTHADNANLAPATPPSKAVAPPDTVPIGRFNAGDEWVNHLGMVFCWCPPGTFTAGSPEDTPGRYPDEAQRQVEVRDGFWIGKYEHTRGQKLRNLSNHSVGTDKNHPVEKLHWDDGRSMLRNLTKQEHTAGRLPQGWQYAMPTSDQWEYAARAGTNTRYYFGNDPARLPEHANFADRSFFDTGDIFSQHAHRTLDDGAPYLAPVGSYKPNPWGLHDVYGNVYEWCSDNSARGGSWVTRATNCRSAYRDHYSSRNDQTYLGYRFVIQKTPPQP